MLIPFAYRWLVMNSLWSLVDQPLSIAIPVGLLAVPLFIFLVGLLIYLIVRDDSQKYELKSSVDGVEDEQATPLVEIDPPGQESSIRLESDEED